MNASPDILIDCLGLHNIKNSKALNILPLYILDRRYKPLGLHCVPLSSAFVSHSDLLLPEI